MKRQLLMLILAWLVDIAGAQTYIKNVTVIDVVNLKKIPGQTILIKGDRIADVKPAEQLKIPGGATVIDGKGKYLMPGLVDAHVHFFQSGGIYTRPDVIDLRKFRSYDDEIEWVHENLQDQLQRYIRAGITTVIDPGSNLHFLQQRDSFKTNTRVPGIYMTGPLLTTYMPQVYEGLENESPFFKINTEEEAREYVGKELPYHPDFIKIWFIVLGDTDSSARASLPLVKSAIDEAHLHGLKAAVHATQRITAQLAVENGADYLVHSIDDEVMPDEFVKMLKTKNVVLCPTLIVGRNYYEVFAQQYKPTEEDKSLANPETLASLGQLQNIPDTLLVSRYKLMSQRLMNKADIEDSVMAVNLKKLSDAGVIIATGTDAGNIGTLHASSYFREIKKMQEAGMTAAKILQASTINGAKVLGKQDEFGSISKGKLANMVLLNADPLADLENWQKIDLVINKGKVATR